MGPVRRRVDLAVRHALSVIEDIAAGERLQQVYAPQQRTLAGAGGSDDAGHISLGHRKIDVPQHLMRAEGFGQVPNLQNHIVHISVPPWSVRV